MIGQQGKISKEKRADILMKMKLECLRMNELVHTHDAAADVIPYLKDLISWMHHQIKSYALEENIEMLFMHFNWTVKEVNESLKIHREKQLDYLKD